MAGKKKFGAFAGVFTPSILTILGVIMYMRMGWVVGNAGLVGTLVIIAVAHIISIATGLSVASIATDKKVGAGGIYYILSRSMGVPIGGAIGLTLYVGTAFSIALYLIGFAESFNSYIGLDTEINGLRLSGSAALLVLTGIALISTSVAIKTQFIILTAILLSLASIFLGSNEFAPNSTALFIKDSSVSLEVIFAVFFPAVTGFTAGVAMSGDLKNPKKDIPIGTIASIAVGLIVYITLAIFLANYVDAKVLREDYNILVKIALYAPLVIAGIWGATLSSALGGVLGSPRILQAMSLDSITPRIFGRGKGKNNEPVNALILVFIIAQAGILIGDLDMIARIVSMFYLAAYGVINISFFLESWANPDFQPTFKIKPWIGLVGFIASFAVMFRLDMFAMFGAIIIILLIYFWIKRKEIALESGDVWQSVWESIVAKGLKKLDAKEADTSNNWNPNIILFSGESGHQSYLLELANTVAGRTGIVTNFKLILDRKSEKPLKKTEQIVKDKNFEKIGVFGRQVRVDNIYKGIENIATSFGFSGVEPNTIMMGWPRELSHSRDYSLMTQKLLYLDYNLLYLDFDRKTKFGKYRTVDLWWRETDSKNAEMMLSIARFILQSPQWNKATIRVLFVNHNNIDNHIIRVKIAKLVENLRVNVEIKIVNNGVEQKPFYDIIAMQSAHTDLTLIGIPNFKTEKQAEFIIKTDHLFETMGSVIMVKASNNFNKIELDFSYQGIATSRRKEAVKPLPNSLISALNNPLSEYDSHLAETTRFLEKTALTSISSYYHQFISSLQKKWKIAYLEFEKHPSIENSILKIQDFLNDCIKLSKEFKKDTLVTAKDLLRTALHNLLQSRRNFLKEVPRVIREEAFGKRKKSIYWRKILTNYYETKILPNLQNTLYDFGVQSFVLLNYLTDNLSSKTLFFIESLTANKKERNVNPSEFDENIHLIFDELKNKSLLLKEETLTLLRTNERTICIELLEELEKKEQKSKSTKNKKSDLQIISLLTNYASAWYRNQLLAHNQAEAECYLFFGGLSICNANENILSYFRENIIRPQRKSLSMLLSVSKKLLKAFEFNNFEDIQIQDLKEFSENTLPVTFGNFIENEEENGLTVFTVDTSTTEILSADSFNVLFEKQDEHLESISLPFSNIQEHILQSGYWAPLQDVVSRVERITKETAEEIYNATHLLKHLINEPKESKEIVQKIEVVTDIQNRINTNLKKLDEIAKSFDHDTKTNLHNTISNLKVRTLIESEEMLPKMIGKSIIRPRFQNWYSKKVASINNFYKNTIRSIVQHKQDIEALQFDEAHRSYLSASEQLASFMGSLQINSEVDRELHFYYKKIFSGSHIAGDNTENQKAQKSAQKAFEKMKSGISGALLIIGEASTGKTYLTETLARSLPTKEKYHINPPSGLRYKTRDLDVPFQKLFHKKGTAETILKQVEKGSIFVFNDLEKWWLKTKGGSELIDYLIKIITLYGNKHYFLLNCNIHSYSVMRKTSQIEKALLATIVMSPVSRPLLQEIIIKRHKIAGAELWYNNELLEEAKNTRFLFNEIHKKSGGKVGVALHLWLCTISLNKENSVADEKYLTLNKPEPLAFPRLENALWKLLLYQLLLHNELRLTQFKKIFEADDSNWIMSCLQEMLRTGVIEEKSNKVYTIKNVAKPYVEEWLRELSIV